VNETIEFLVRHGAVVLFAAVLIEQIGVPLPAAPWLLAAGALVGAGRMHWMAALGASSIASVIADLVWFYLGRHYGNRVLRLLCRISLEPDTCVRRTEGVFTRYGMKGVVVAKFIPGLSTLAPPLAGSYGVSAPRFLFFDGLSSILYTGCFILAGVLFSRQLEEIINALSGLGRGALGVVAAFAALYIGYRYFQRRRILNELRMARITVDELHQRQEAGESLLILDLRSQFELEQDPGMIRGALHITMDELRLRQQDIPRDRDIILYCDCPNEVSSARMALQLRQHGITRVRPLLGGIEAWRERKYPTDLLVIGVKGARDFGLLSGESRPRGTTA
jgi:membrane protein DedA with SNARE-associated domain/rhodanese-related sulfurtransferase